LSESVVLIVFADGEVDKVPCYAVEIDIEEVVEELQTVLIDVTLHSFLRERLCPLQILNRDFCGLFEYYKSIDVPGVETEATTPIIDELCKELEDHQDYIIIVYEGCEGLSNDREELRIKPVEEQSEVLLSVHTMHDAPQDMEEFHEFKLHSRQSFQRSIIELENFMHYRVQLRDVSFKPFHEILIHPERRQDLEECRQML